MTFDKPKTTGGTATIYVGNRSFEVPINAHDTEAEIKARMEEALRKAVCGAAIRAGRSIAGSIAYAPSSEKEIDMFDSGYAAGRRSGLHSGRAFWLGFCTAAALQVFFIIVCEVMR